MNCNQCDISINLSTVHGPIEHICEGKTFLKAQCECPICHPNISDKKGEVK